MGSPVFNTGGAALGVARWVRLPCAPATTVDPAVSEHATRQARSGNRAGSSSAGIAGPRPRIRSVTSPADAGPVEIPHGP